VLIWNPCVTVIGQTQFDPDGFEQWMLLNGLGNHQSAHPDSPLHALWSDVSDEYALERMVEFGGRHCYRSWMNGRSRADYVRNIIEMGHGSVLEHSTLNLAIQGVSRSLSHELVRHRVGVAISQESQRYVEASDIQFVVPPMVAYLAGGAHSNADEISNFYRAQLRALDEYKRLQSAIVSEIQRRESKVKSLTLIKKRANEAARAHLPNAAETRLLWTANLRLLRHFLWLRGGAGADLEIRRLAVALLDDAQQRAPTVFEDMAVADGSYGVPIIVAKS
jgi:thymidylate synthase (FAD)